ncbi:hypothetical protein FXN61_36430 [Lentzea sp. PSKA42]|uniref:Secreted protein n=1 Tax=Lentzea indica TaxID=2604800 RepID=A0ABX1FT89_9PSEU|nr:hypothetical protein [Lentzea indica]NKE61955.1 hypothetical protein [Lentzea indica]
MGALLVPLAILAGALFDSVTKAPGAVANVIENAGGDEPHTVVVTTVAIPPRPEGFEPETAAAAASDAVVTASPAEQPAVAAPQRTVSESLDVQSCDTVRDTVPRASKEPPAASMSVGVLPGRSAANRDGREESRPGRPVRCG